MHQLYIQEEISKTLEQNVLKIFDNNVDHLFANYKITTLQPASDDFDAKLRCFMMSRLTSLGVAAVREYQRVLDTNFEMLQCDPEERAEVDMAIRKITREVQKGITKFVDMLDMGDTEDIHGNLKGFYGSERINQYYEEKESSQYLKIVKKLSDLNSLFTQYFTFN